MMTPRPDLDWWMLRLYAFVLTLYALACAGGRG